jgi:ankyrin repeat protein
MKYIKLYENFEPHDPYELMMIPPNKKAEMIIGEIKKREPNLNLVSDLIVLGANLDWQDESYYNFAPLHVAAWFGRVEIVRMLIDAGADVEAKDNDGWAPLHRAAGNVEIARMLIDAGANVNVQDEKGWTPLHVAALNERVEIVRVIIGAKAKLNVQNNYGWTPLHVVAIYGNVEIARMLIDAGARKDIRDDEGRLPYDLADNEELKKLLKS